MGIPFEREDNSLRSLGRGEVMSTLQSTGITPFQAGAVNEGPNLYGAFEDNFTQHPSLLTEPVAPSTLREGYPEGAVDYVANAWGVNELDLDRESYRWAGPDRLTDEYVGARNAGLDPVLAEDSVSPESSATSGSWMSYDPDEGSAAALDVLRAQPWI